METIKIVLNGLYLPQNYYKVYFKKKFKVMCVFSFRIRLRGEGQLAFFFCLFVCLFLY